MDLAGPTVKIFQKYLKFQLPSIVKILLHAIYKSKTTNTFLSLRVLKFLVWFVNYVNLIGPSIKALEILKTFFTLCSSDFIIMCYFYKPNTKYI